MHIFLLSLLASFGTFVHYGTSEGLQNSYLTDIEMDSSGYIWMSSEAGLSRFDGYAFTNLNRTNSGLVQNRLNALQYSPDANVIFVGSGAGVYIVDCSTLEVRALPDISGDVICVEESSDGNILAANRGGSVYRISPDGENVEEVDYEGLSGSMLSLLDLDGYLIVGHDGGGMSVVNKETGAVTRYVHDPDDPFSLPGRRVYCIYRDNYDHIWVGTEHGLGLYNPSADNFTCFRYDPDDPDSIISDHIYTITELSGHRLWICTDIGGISVLDIRQIHYGNNDAIGFENIYATYDENGLSSRNVRKVLEDDYNNIWIVNHSSGLDCLRKSPVAFHKLVYTESRRSSKNKLASSVAIDDGGGIWVGLENEVARFRADGSLDKAYLLAPYLTHSNALVYSLLIKGDYLYMGLYDSGLLKMNVNTGAVTRVNIGSDVDVNGLSEDEDGSIWVGTKRGVVHISGDGRDRILRTFGSGSFYSFLRDRSGNLWAASYGNGIFVFDKDGQLSARISRDQGLPTIVPQLCMDAEGRIWAATEEGVACFNDPSDFRLYGHQDGLSNSYIHGIQADLLGNVWLSTDTGISMIDPSSSEVRNYSSYYGVPSSNFIDGASAISGDGMIFFGSQGGLCFFNPAEVLSTQELSGISIKECFFFEDASLTPAERLIPVKNGTVTLHHNHKSFMVSFGVRDYSQLGAVEYEYCIPEIDGNWIRTMVNAVSFRKLPSGKYTFMVRALLENNPTAETESASLNITIEPPFLLEWWFLVLYVLIALACAGLLLHRYINKVKTASQNEMERRNNLYEQELNKERLAFYTNITHELRTPLTLIIGPLDDMRKDRDLSQGLKVKLDLVRNSAKHLLDLVNQLLEFRKTETYNRRLAVRKTDLRKFLNEVGVQFKELNSNSGVNFVVDVPDCETDLLLDRTVLSIIINNLLGNAAKYTREGEIRLKLDWCPGRAPSTAFISVSDTGCGISPKDLPHIFDRFYQAKSGLQTSGTGIGLALSKTMAELHQGTLSVESVLGEGSVFTLALNVDADYPDAIHDDDLDGIDGLYDAEEGEESGDVREKSIVLVVEDHDDIRDYIASSLKDEFSVITADNGLEGLKQAQSFIPDIIVSDVMMPEMNGLDMCRRIKEDLRTSHIPVILLTAKNSLDDQREGYDTGADSYLTKPFSISLLTSRITNILETRRRVFDRLIHDRFSARPQADPGQADEAPELSRLDMEFISSFRKIVEDNMSNSDLDMRFIQEAMGLSHSTLYRKIKALTGSSTIELIRKIRLEHSRKMLKEEGLNVSETAYVCGFNDVGHFISCFKKEYGVTPSKFRAKQKHEKGA